jgi:uncharacterized protein (DUF1499 family)
MAPLSYSLPEADVREELRRVLEAQPRTRITADEPSYLHAEASSRVFGFVDDVEFWIDSESHLIHFRSASRTGYWDLGANRRRMVTICDALTDVAGIERVETESGD